MVKYHISPETGRPNICKADKKPCPLGEDKPHFETKEAARKHYEKDNASKTITKPLTKKNPSDKNRASPQLAKSLKFWSKHKDWYVRRDVAGDSRTPAHLLEALSKDEDGRVRRWVASNPNTPAHVLEKLSKDKDRDVRIRVAWNKNTSLLIMEKLVNDVRASVRFAALTVTNPSIPLNIVKKLAVTNEDDDKEFSYMKNYHFMPRHIRKELDLLTS